jgi:hypothetical protein
MEKPVPRSQLNIAGVVVACIAGLMLAANVPAQEPRTTATLGLAVSTQFPDRVQAGCGNLAAAAPSVRVHQRLHRIVSAELGIAGAFRLASCSSADLVPLQDGEVFRNYDTPRGKVSLSTEGRIVLTPLGNEDGALRLIGGGAWFPVSGSPAWIVGAGFRPPRSWGAFVFDVEYWNVGVAYDLERFRSNAPREFLSDGREWQGFLQVRAGLTIWSH